VRSRLATAREERGWSQTRLIAELERRSRAAGLTVMSRSSLKTALSRWENGHVVPDSHYRRLFREIFGLSDVELGFGSLRVTLLSDGQAFDRAHGASSTLQTPCVDAATDVRRCIDQLLSADTSACVAGLEERVSLQAQACIRVAPSIMLNRLLLDFTDVQPLLQQTISPRLAPRLFEIAANLSALVGDELMVLGRPADSQAWYTTAKTAALRTGSPPVLARTLSLNALLYLYYGTPRQAVELAQRTYAADREGPGSRSRLPSKPSLRPSSATSSPPEARSSAVRVCWRTKARTTPSSASRGGGSSSTEGGPSYGWRSSQKHVPS
jgi:transcriptional regulator with XRE-family HTH domain